MFKIQTTFFKGKETLHPEIVAMELDEKYKGFKVAPMDQFEQRYELSCMEIAKKHNVEVTFKGDVAIFHDKLIKV